MLDGSQKPNFVKCVLFILFLKLLEFDLNYFRRYLLYGIDLLVRDSHGFDDASEGTLAEGTLDLEIFFRHRLYRRIKFIIF